MTARSRWIFCLPLSLFIFGCSSSHNGERIDPQLSPRGRGGFQGPNLQLPTPEQAKKARREVRLADERMAKILERLTRDDSEESRSLKSEWSELDEKILSGKATKAEIGTLDKKVPDAKVAAAEDGATRTIEQIRTAFLVRLGNLSEEAHQIEEAVAGVKNPERLSSFDFEIWGDAAFYADNFDIRYPFLRHSVRSAKTFAELADVSRQLKYPNPNLTPEMMLKVLVKH